MPSLHWYDRHATTIVPHYESLSFEQVHGWLLDLIPTEPGLTLDVGAGSGRDAAWLAQRGHEVIAVEPSAAMRTEAQRLHPEARIRWIDDHLPALSHIHRLDMAFDFILVSAVWMHIAPGDRPRAFRKLITLLKPGGLLAITLRHGPAEPEREIYEVSWEEVERLAREHGAAIVRRKEASDQLGRSDVTWTQIVIALPDDGTGALPLLRHVILNEKKSSTYKLALLRVLCRIADSTAGVAQHQDEEYVVVSMGLVALYWIRLFKPLTDADLPQSRKIIREAKNWGLLGKDFDHLPTYPSWTYASEQGFRVQRHKHCSRR